MTTDSVTEIQAKIDDSKVQLKPKGVTYKPIYGGIYKVEGLTVSNAELGKRYTISFSTLKPSTNGFMKLISTGAP